MPRHRGYWADLAAAREEQGKTAGAATAYRQTLALGNDDDSILWVAKFMHGLLKKRYYRR